MQSKLTLRVDADLIMQAKKVAGERGTSVSRLVTDYLRALTHERSDSSSLGGLPPVTASLVGSLSDGDTTADPKQAYREFLESKHR